MTTIKRLIVLSASVLLATAAWAGNMDARIGNTVVAKAPDGTVTKFYYEKGGSFTATIEEPGKPTATVKGKWRQDGDKLCVTSEAAFGPFEANKERCLPLLGDKVGDTWKSKGRDAAGNEVDVVVTIVAGR
jgi:hypothetical protein